MPETASEGAIVGTPPIFFCGKFGSKVSSEEELRAAREYIDHLRMVRQVEREEDQREA